MSRRDLHGRRPLLATFDGNNRLMLQQIRDSLSYLRKPQDEPSNLTNIPLKDLSRSTPNLTDKPGKPVAGRSGYKQHALAQIRQSLEKFQVGEETIGPNLDNGLEVPDARKLLWTISEICGCDEVYFFVLILI